MIIRENSHYRKFKNDKLRRISMKSLQTGGKVKADRDRGIMFGDTEIDLSYVEQLVDTSQTRFEIIYTISLH